ncbi:MAG: phasin family protein [Gammaproteobacteria bacterium]
MATEMKKDSTDFINATLESLKQITESNIASAKTWFAPPFAVSDWAQVGKSSLSFAHSWADLSKRIFDESLIPCLRVSSPESCVTALKELSEITTTAVESLSRSQVDTMNANLDELAQFAANLKKVEGADDLFAAQMQFLIQLQQQAKDSALASFQILNSTKSAIAAWSEKSLDTAAETASMPKPKKTAEKEQKAA